MINVNKTTFINTNLLPRLKAGQGELTEILNQELAGAENVACNLRWLKAGEQFTPEVTNKHQLLYLMEGRGRIRLEGKNHNVSKGAGIYLGPSEVAVITADPELKLLHILVPKIPA